MRLQFVKYLVIAFVIIACDSYAQDTARNTFKIKKSECKWDQNGITFARRCTDSNLCVDISICKNGMGGLIWEKYIPDSAKQYSIYITADTDVDNCMLRTLTPSFIDDLSKFKGGSKSGCIYITYILENGKATHLWNMDVAEVIKNPALMKLLKPLIDGLNAECKKYITKK